MRGVAGLGKGLFEIFGSFAIVFDQKNLHAVFIRGFCRLG